MNTEMNIDGCFDQMITQVQSMIERAELMTDSKQTIYTTIGYDESLTGTVDQIIEHIESDLGDRVEKSAGMIGPILKVFEATACPRTDEDVCELKLEIQLLETTVL
tara:strand:+ start:11587 stop:11904 length:318 start_codon:yes stop_codon:yes gene_type:complete